MTNTIGLNVPLNSDDKTGKYNWLLYFAHSFTSDHITTDHYYYFL